MCLDIDRESRIYNEKHPEENFPKVLLAIIRIKQSAENDHETILDYLEQVTDMRTILNKLILTHIDSDSYSDHLFTRAEQLSSHLKTYKKIVDKVDIGEDIRIYFQEVTNQFTDYIRERLNFKTMWIESMEIIRDGKKSVDNKFHLIEQIRAQCESAYSREDYLRLKEVKSDCDLHFGAFNDLMDTCLTGGKQCKEYGKRLYEMLAQLEVSFHDVIQITMKRIHQLKLQTHSPSQKHSDN